MRWVAARIKPPPTHVTLSELEEVLAELATVEHVFIRARGDAWLVGAFVLDDGTLTPDISETIVRGALAEVAGAAGAGVEMESQFVSEDAGALFRPPTPEDPGPHGPQRPRSSPDS